MWPKVLMQLVELLPHASRLLPLADRYLSASGSNEKALATMGESLTAMDGSLGAMAAGVQGSLGQVARAHVDVAGRLDAFAAEHLALAARLEESVGQVTEIGIEAKRARRAAELAQTRVDALEKQLAAMRTLVLAGMGGLLALLVAVLVLLVRGHVGTGF